jgi:hypothetical protein
VVSPCGPKLSKLGRSWASLLLAGDASRRLRRLLCVPWGSWSWFVCTGAAFSFWSELFGFEEVLSVVRFSAVSEGRSWAEGSVLVGG